MRTVSRCNPNVRAASRMLIPSTITALRTRRYMSTLYIHPTVHRLDFQPMDGGGRYSIPPPNVSGLLASRNVSGLPAHVVHFSPAAYSRLENLYQALETKQLPIEALSPRILALKARQDQLTAAREEAEGQLEQRRAELLTSQEIKGYVADFREFLREGTFPERKALIRNFVQGIEIVEDEAVLTYTIPCRQTG